MDFRTDRGVLHAARVLHARGRGDRVSAIGLDWAIRIAWRSAERLLRVRDGAPPPRAWRELWPGRHVLHVAALAFFVCGALVLKTAAMFHPEPLDPSSRLGPAARGRMIARDDYRPVLALALGAVLGACPVVRAFSLWTFAVVLFALAGAALVDPPRRRRVLAAGAIAVAVTAVVADRGTRTNRGRTRTRSSTSRRSRSRSWSGGRSNSTSTRACPSW